MNLQTDDTNACNYQITRKKTHTGDNMLNYKNINTGYAITGVYAIWYLRDEKQYAQERPAARGYGNEGVCLR